MTWGKGRPHTRAYRKDTARVLARCGHRCEIRGPNCTGVATEDDHIIPKSAGGSDAMSNRRGACATCHGEKTQAEAHAARAASAAKAIRPSKPHPGLR